MRRRELDGFELISATEPKEADAPFYEPAILVRRLDSEQVEVHAYFATSQNVKERSQEQAQYEADAWVMEIEYVRHFGEHWDIH